MVLELRDMLCSLCYCLVIVKAMFGIPVLTVTSKLRCSHSGLTLVQMSPSADVSHCKILTSFYSAENNDLPGFYAM